MSQADVPKYWDNKLILWYEITFLDEYVPSRKYISQPHLRDV